MSKRIESVILPMTIEVQGKTWDLYPVYFDTDCGTFLTYIYGISQEHAELVCQDLKDTAQVVGPAKDTIVIL